MSTRIKTRNLISFFSFNKTGKLISEGLGVALDISEGGILLETPYPIKSGLLVAATTDNKNNLFEVKCKLMRTRKTSTGTFLSGIKFIRVDQRMEQFISNLIKEYNFRGKNLHIAVRQKLDKMNRPSIAYKKL
jgi:c-di-GMP-binding flagellar brake protein YcgR